MSAPHSSRSSIRSFLLLVSYFLFLISFLFLLSSCSVQLRPPIIEQGTEGLRIKITVGNNNVLYENTPASILVDVENRGSSIVDHGILVLNVPEQYIESSRELQEYLDLQGKSIDNPVGEMRQYDFNVKVREMTEEAKQQSAIISASACYQYTTIASPTLCLQRPGDNKPSCKEKSVSLGGQGGPLAVTNVEATLSPSENDRYIPIITLTVRNKDGGLIVDPENVLNACLGTDDSAKEGVVLLTAYLDHDGRPLTCGKSDSAGQTKINLKDGSATVTCKYADGIPASEGTHNSQIIINLAYGYHDITTQKVVMRKT